MRTKISVTEEHIRNGLMADCESCPVAIAIREKIISSADVNVTRFQTIIGDEELLIMRRFTNPKQVMDFTRNFDHLIPVKPFSFYLDIPKRFLK